MKDNREYLRKELEECLDYQVFKKDITPNKKKQTLAEFDNWVNQAKYGNRYYYDGNEYELTKCKLTTPEFNAVKRYTGMTKIDSIMDVEPSAQSPDIDCFYNFDDCEEVSLVEGLIKLRDSIKRPLSKDVPFEEAVVIANIYERFNLTAPEV